MNFSGSYAPDDVTFLLKRVHLAPTELAEKERLIQSGERHYSEMIGMERAPTPAYLRVFHAGLEREKGRFARDLLVLARHIATTRRGPIVVVSLARAGTPVGVLVRRILRRMDRSVHHYSVSIIRDRGIDETALRHLLARHSAEAIVFVDGWTGKGVIAGELHAAVTAFNQREGTCLDAGLYVVADLCGAAAFAASDEDYLIPSCVLGATVSGLVSRSILNDAVIGPGDFHGCLWLEELAPADQSRWFVDQVAAEVERQVRQVLTGPQDVSSDHRSRLRARSETFLADMRMRFGVRDIHHVKPGVGEATRVLLRRVPDRLLLRDPSRADVAHLLLLAREKNTPIVIDPALPYTAAALIKEMDG
ncbi:MAG: cysteine protease StiP family protein [Planctomycetes bacterium]|nr:cysteine protease StiP family protein [Planctomycetota bacterium]